MTRTNIYSTDEYTGESALQGWFDPDVSERFDEPTFWDGNNHRGLISRLQCGHECLYRTKGGRWVRHYDARNEFNGPETYEFFTDAQAHDWLLRAELDAAAVRFFGPIESEKGPGRPEIGPTLKIAFPQELIDRIEAARQPGESRSAAVRRLVGDALA